MRKQHVSRFRKKATTYDKWDDPEFILEMERRIEGLKSGVGKRYTWEEVKERAKEKTASLHAK